MDFCTECDCCGSLSPGIREFSEFSHVTTCTVTDHNGNKRQGWKPVFSKIRELCFACYKSAVRKYVAETRTGKISCGFTD